jgi:tetratricopeptide (TPR) repeat protein
MTKKNDIKAKELLAKIYMERGEIQNALKEYVGITLSSASNVIEKSYAYGAMVKIYFQEKNFTKAIAAAGSGLKYNKENVDIYYHLGKIYLIMDKERRAGRMFNEVLKYDRTHLASRMELANMHIKEKNFTKARFQLKKILETEPENDEARYRLGEIYYAEDDLEDAALSSSGFLNKSEAKRAYINVLGARLAMKHLFSKKIKATNLRKYGVQYPMQLAESRRKRKITFMKN